MIVRLSDSAIVTLGISARVRTGARHSLPGIASSVAGSIPFADWLKEAFEIFGIFVEP
jgi:hypothetical protein